MREPTRLFVYGTLKEGSGHPMQQTLARRADLVGHGRVPGRLYDLGPYPGAVPHWGADEPTVSGDVYELGDPDGMLVLLDRYEGCAPDDEDRLFERRQTWVTLSGQEGSTRRVWAWVYWYRGPMEGATLIPSGCWPPEAGGTLRAGSDGVRLAP